MSRIAGGVACCLLAAGRAAAEAEGRGFAEVRGSSYFGVTGDRWQAVERVRPTFETSFGERVKLVGTVEAGGAQGRGAPARFSRASDYLDVDRLYLDAYGERADVRAGRQALHWGSAQFFNPTDPFPEVLLTEPWRPRRGVNAVRAHVALAERTDVTGVAALDDRLANARAAARARTNRFGTDLAVVGAWPGDSDWLAGLDLRGTFGVGWWIEAALHSAGGRAEEAAVGADYSFPVFERLVTMVQYQRNAAGRTGLPGVGRDSLLAAVTAQATPELGLSVAVLRNLDDDRGVAIPSASWAATDWLEVAAMGSIVLGSTSAGLLTVWTRASF